MNSPFSIRLRVTPEMTARFFDCEIHPLYATFKIVEHAEYVSRCAILPFLEPEEDALGSSVEVEHIAPARVGDIVKIEARVVSVEGRDITCKFSVTKGEQELARGKTVQRVVKKR
ncbi:MAG: thioesterase [Ignavibacteriae bacterium]|nr:thioesterase [Ignavibacteriota bacterium]MCB9214452.1 thioesterase [Ignavibacteria bacterium]